MKLPLLGIIVVVCIQLGFTAFNAINRPIESLVVVNAINLGANPVIGLFDDLTNDDSSGVGSAGNTAASTRRRSIRSIELTYVPPKRVVNSDNGNRFTRMSQYVAMQRPFESTVITYPRVIMTSTESDNFSLTTPIVPLAALEKRSFVSKTASVLKKPFTWIKALGAKLN